MQNEKKIAVTVAAIAVFAVLLFSYVNSLDNGSSDAPEVKDDVVVGDYVSLRYEKVMKIESHDEESLDYFYDMYFAPDLDGLSYVGETTYGIDGKEVLCDEYGSEIYTVYVTKSGICVYEETNFSTASTMTNALVHCSLDVEKGFTKDDIAVGMEFIKLATAKSYTETMEFTVDSVEDGNVGFIVFTTSGGEQTYTYTVTEVHGNEIVLDNGQEITKDEFKEVLSKDYMYEEMAGSIEIEKVVTKDIKYESDFGTFDAFVDQITGTTQGYNAYVDLFYAGEGVFLKLGVMYTSEKVSTMTIIEIVDSSMYV